MGSIIDSAFRIFQSTQSAPMECEDDGMVIGSLDQLEALITEYTSSKVAESNFVNPLMAKLSETFSKILSSEDIDCKLVKMLNGKRLRLKRSVIVMLGNKELVDNFDEKVVSGLRALSEKYKLSDQADERNMKTFS